MLRRDALRAILAAGAAALLHWVSAGAGSAPAVPGAERLG
jgi:hypothetical protein